MCGIVGVLNRDGQPVTAEGLRVMRDRMVHRGPDDSGLHLEGNVGLGHRRLSIVDLSTAGHQPMCNEDETIWLVFNGEIYNYLELIEELRRLGHRFRSSTDSEVIMHLYEEIGEECLERLNGMFGFVLWDARKRKLFGARDRMGIKPLYYHSTPIKFAFASEIKALLADREISRQPDLCGVADYLFCGRPLAGRTLFAEVSELLPGWAFRVTVERSQFWEYWRLPAREPRSDISENDAIEALAGLIDDSVRIECRSDEEVVCHLSGGLDSSTIACLAAKHRRPLKSFSIRSPGHSYYDETDYAKLVSHHAGTDYLEGDATCEDMDALVPRLVWHMDSPMPAPGGINYFTLSRLASQHVKVTLTGHGGDEVFAGYPAQFAVGMGHTRMFPESGAPPSYQRESLCSRVAAVLVHGGVPALVQRLRARLTPLTAEARWVQQHCAPLTARDPALHPDFIHALAGYSPEDSYLEAFRGSPSSDLMDRCVYHDLRTYLPALLHMEDRTSMANSIESRVPLLDHRIAEFVAQLPHRYRPEEPKGMLRAAARRWLPREILDRREKRGFPLPVEQWFANELSGPTRRIFLSHTTVMRHIFREGALKSPAFGSTRGWAALNLELWWRIFVDEQLDPGTPLTEVAG